MIYNAIPSEKVRINKSITICAVDFVFPHMAAKALERSSQHFYFDEIILFSHEHVVGSHKTIIINQINSISDYNQFLIKILNNYIDTDFVLIVQWDGYVINHHAWISDFLDYDYIGATWPQYKDNYNVGNGGFSLRSKKLLVALNRLVDEDTYTCPEDDFICRKNRFTLENEYNIKFAPSELADKFSYEQTTPVNNTFGFHGFWNMLSYIDEQEALTIVKNMPDNYFSGYLIIKSFIRSYYLVKYNLMVFLYMKIVKQIGEDNLHKTLIMALKFDENDAFMALKKSRQLFILNELNCNTKSSARFLMNK